MLKNLALLSVILSLPSFGIYVLTHSSIPTLLRQVFLFFCYFLLFLLPPLVFHTSSTYFQFFAYVMVTFFFVKLVSYHNDIQRGRDIRKGIIDFINFVFFYPGAVFSESLIKRSIPLPKGHYTRLILYGCIKLGIGSSALFLYIQITALHEYDFLDSLFKAVFYAMLIDGLNNFSDVNLSFRGFKTRKVFGKYYLASNPIEFWQEWNALSARWFNLYIARSIFRKLGIFPSIMITFGISGILHEYVWGLPVNKITGHMVAFFCIHGLAVFSVKWGQRNSFLRQLSLPKPFSIMLTFIFNIFTLSLYFVYFDRIFHL